MWTLGTAMDAAHWDALVAAHGGGPLQTALWGDARAASDGTASERLILARDATPALFARVEVRRHPLAGKIAWIPQGPVYVDPGLAFDASVELKARLRRRGYHVCFENPCPVAPPRYGEQGQAVGEAATTSIVDLTPGEAALWTRLGPDFRNQVRAAQRHGCEVRANLDEATVARFVAECERHSAARGYRHQGDLALVRRLLQSADDAPVRARLFCASREGQFGGGILVMVVGATMQLMQSATVRGKRSPTRLLHWEAMRSAIAAGVARYDLGGVDSATNAGVAAFKRELRGTIVTLPPIRGSALDLRGRVALATGRAVGRI